MIHAHLPSTTARNLGSFLFAISLMILPTIVRAQQFSAPTYQESYPTTNSYQTPSYNTNTYNATPESRYNSGYTRQNGTVVNPYYSTVPDNTNRNNYSTQSNINPYTGQTGTRARDYSSEAYNYGQGKTIQTGPRGGQYYINDNGNKVYVPKRSNPY